MDILILYILFCLLSTVIIVTLSRSHLHVFLFCTITALCILLPVTYLITDGFRHGFLGLGAIFIALGWYCAIAIYLLSHIGYLARTLIRSKNRKV